MIKTLINWCVVALSFMAAAYLLPGFYVGHFGSALIIAFVVGLVSVFLKPVLVLITLPINILTLGLFTLVINGMILKFSAFLLPNFQVDGWGSAILGAIVVTVVSMLLRFVLGIKKNE